MVHTLERSIVLTLAYSAQFNFPLSAREVWQRLLISTTFDFEHDLTIPTLDLVSEVLTTLVERGYVFKQGEYFSTRRFDNWGDRKKLEVHAEQKLAEAQGLATRLRWIPWILAVGVSGSVGARNARANDDKDFIIKTRKNNLLLSRIFVSILAFQAGKRRSWNHEEENSWCFNLWLDEDAIRFRPERGLVYVAYELCQVYWVLEKDSVVSKLFRENNWVLHLLPIFFTMKKNCIQHLHYEPSSLSACDVITSACNRVAYYFQRLYMQQHMTRERVSYSAAFFHPRDTIGGIYLHWRNELESWKDYATKI